jgi:hypothetical protein
MQNIKTVILGLLVLLSVFFLPFWYNDTSALENNEPVLEKADTIDPETGEEYVGPCDRFVEEDKLDVWRTNHMSFASFYLDYEPKVEQCDKCHRNPDEFCNKCHAYAGVKLSTAPRDDTSVQQLIPVLFRSGEVTEKVHHHRWMENIIGEEDIKDRRCFACHRDTHCAKCHVMRDPLKKLAE